MTYELSIVWWEGDKTTYPPFEKWEHVCGYLSNMEKSLDGIVSIEIRNLFNIK